MGTQIGEIVEKKEIDLDFLSHKTVGVDAFNTLYQFISIIRGADGSPLMDSKGRITSHLTGLLYRTVNLLEKDIKPVFVFDGKALELKKETQEERHKIRTEAEKKYKEALKEGALEEAKKFAMMSSRLTTEMIQQAKDLVEMIGLPVIQAPSDGEAQIAFMVDKGELFGCVSQDYDSLLFGAKKLFRNITISGKRKAPGKNYYYDIKPEMIELEQNLKTLGIDRGKLIWIGILVGTDFNEKFPRVGPKTALQLVKELDSFEKIIEKTKHKPEFDYKEIEKIFLKPLHTSDYSIKFKAPQKEKIVDYLCDQFDFSKERVESALNKLEEKTAFGAEQSTLGQWG